MRTIHWNRPLVFFLLAGLGLLAGAGYAAWQELRFRDGAVETEAQVVQLQWGFPVFAFTLPDGTTQQAVSQVRPNLPVGERVRIRYRPEAPEDVRMSGFGASWGTAALLAGFGAAILLLILRMMKSAASRRDVASGPSA